TVVADKIFPIMPSKKLIEHEWRKHGTCSGLDQKTYFNRSDELYHELKFPEFFYKNNISTIMADDIIKEFKKTNPNLAKQDSIRVVAKGQKGKQFLQEIRICYNKEFNPLTCPSPRLTNPNTFLEIIPPKGSSLGDDSIKLVIPEKGKNTPKTVNLNLACKLQIQENNIIALNCAKTKI
ncbi:MAG: hypothetical protein AAGB33_00180, partial [Cellulomonas sp.]|nr:hypothetical protein [Rickettsiella sp.]